MKRRELESNTGEARIILSPWKSLIAIAVSCCAQHFQGGGSSSAVFPPRSLPSPSGRAVQAHVDREWAAQGQAGSRGQGAGRWAVQACAGAGLYRQCICHARLPPSGLSHMLVPSSHMSAACLSSVPFLDGNTQLRLSNAVPFPPALVVQQAQGSLAASLGRASQCRSGSRTRGKPWAQHTAKVTLACYSRRRKG